MDETKQILPDKYNTKSELTTDITSGSNTANFDLTLDLGTDDGLAMLRRLIAESDAVLENFSPRVLGNFGLDWEQIQTINPRCLLVRMPAFGLSGRPFWRQ
jgi:crotonobetainyl-CoA:carnitine CoA-transferase CaiB-like acyl-CoA transferase